jgi:predicted metal-dependent hydrolase
MPARRKASARKLPEPEWIQVDDLRVLVRRKRVKNLTLRVKAPDGHVEISVPLREPQAFIEEMVRSRRPWIDEHAARVRASVSSRAESATKEEIARWRAQIQRDTPLLVAKWEPVLGVKHGSLAYRNMRSRWGSCQPATGRICINVRLALFPPECLEYVVVHELCHLIVPGHGPDFHALLDRHLPDWKAARAKLRE